MMPMTLHRDVRASLPTAITTSLPVWVARNPLSPSTVAVKAETLIPFVKEAILFAGKYGMLKFDGLTVLANLDWKPRMTSTLKRASEEVKLCCRKSAFIGKWFAKTGPAETIFSILGVRP